MILHFHILTPLTINPWWLVLPILLLIVVAIQIWWLQVEAHRLRGKIEKILDLTAMTEDQDKASADFNEVSGDGESSYSDIPDADNPSSGSGEIWQPGKKISKMDRELLARIDAEIEANIQDSEYTIEMLRAKLGVSRSGLYKKLIYLTGRAPLEYIRIKRLQMGRAMLENGETSISQIAWSVGFSPKQFSKYFKDEYGCLPSEYIHYISD